jgi:hypothetical protein
MDRPDTARSTARDSIEILYACYAPDYLFAPDYSDEDLNPEDAEVLRVQGGLPCEGSGVAGPHCTRCAYGKDEVAW